MPTKGYIDEWNENIQIICSSKQPAALPIGVGDQTMKKLGMFLIFCAFVPAARAATYTAASGNLSDVQPAFSQERANSMTDATTAAFEMESE